MFGVGAANVGTATVGVGAANVGTSTLGAEDGFSSAEHAIKIIVSSIMEKTLSDCMKTS